MKQWGIILLGLPAVAFAGLFDDDVARERIEQLRAQIVAVETKLQTLDTFQSGQIDQLNQIQEIQQSVADLRGQIEVLTNDINEFSRRQREFYADLDNRLKKMEAGALPAAPALENTVNGTSDNPSMPSPPVVSQGEETANFDAALRLFEAGKYPASIRAFQNILEYYPNSALCPAAQFWIGNAYYAQQNNKAALAAYDKVVARWPNNPKAPEALVSAAKVYQEMKQNANAKKNLEAVVARYPNSPSAADAKKLLKSL